MGSTHVKKQYSWIRDVRFMDLECGFGWPAWVAHDRCRKVELVTQVGSSALLAIATHACNNHVFRTRRNLCGAVESAYVLLGNRAIAPAQAGRSGDLHRVRMAARAFLRHWALAWVTLNGFAFNVSISNLNAFIHGCCIESAYMPPAGRNWDRNSRS